MPQLPNRAAHTRGRSPSMNRRSRRLCFIADRPYSTGLGTIGRHAFCSSRAAPYGWSLLHNVYSTGISAREPGRQRSRGGPTACTTVGHMSCPPRLVFCRPLRGGWTARFARSRRMRNGAAATHNEWSVTAVCHSLRGPSAMSERLATLGPQVQRMDPGHRFRAVRANSWGEGASRGGFRAVPVMLAAGRRGGECGADAASWLVVANCRRVSM
jgi:hypothetical protein